MAMMGRRNLVMGAVAASAVAAIPVVNSAKAAEVEESMFEQRTLEVSNLYRTGSNKVAVQLSEIVADSSSLDEPVEYVPYNEAVQITLPISAAGKLYIGKKISLTIQEVL